jgi:hypothetical protein
MCSPGHPEEEFQTVEIFVQDVSRKQLIPDDERFNRIFAAALRILEREYEVRAHSQVREAYGITAAEVSDLEMTLSELDVALDWQAEKTDDEVARAWAAATWQALEQQIVARRFQRKVYPRERTAERDGRAKTDLEVLAKPKAPSGSGKTSDVLEAEARGAEEAIASRRTWIEQATPASERRARAMDEIEQLTANDNDKLRRLREEVAAKAVGSSGEQQKAALERLEDIEAVAAARGIEPREEQYTGSVPKRLNLRARIEEGIRRLGSFDKAVAEIRFVDKTSGTASDLAFFEKEANAFKGVFKERARQTAMDMLAGSVNAIKEIVESYGLPWDMTKVAVTDVSRGGDVAKEVAEVVQLAAQRKENDPRYAETRGNLARTTRGLKKLQQSVAEKAAVSDKYFQDFLRAKHKGTFERTHGAAARTADKELAAARDQLAASWIEAEAAHPVLMSLRRSGALEKVDLNRLTSTSTEDRMAAVLKEIVPKLRDANIAANKIRDKQLNPLALPAVVSLTRATMFVPKGSLRDGVINDAVSDAKDAADSKLLQIAAFALAAITFIPSGGASLAIPAGIAAVGLAAHTATREWEKYSTQRMLTNTHLDLARSLATEEPSLTSFAVSLAAIGLEALPLAAAFNKARRLKRLVAAGEGSGSEARAIVKELNELGKKKTVMDDVPLRKASDDVPLGQRALDDIHRVAGGRKPPEVVGKIEAQKPPAKVPNTAAKHSVDAGAKGDTAAVHTARGRTAKPMKEYEEAEGRATTVSAKSGTSKGKKGGGKRPKDPEEDPTAGTKKPEEKRSPDFSEEEPTHRLGSEEPSGEVIARSRVIAYREVLGSVYKVKITKWARLRDPVTNEEMATEGLRALLKAFEAEARRAGAYSLKIEGFAVSGQTTTRMTPEIARKFGYEFERIGAGRDYVLTKHFVHPRVVPRGSVGLPSIRRR